MEKQRKAEHEQEQSAELLNNLGHVVKMEVLTSIADLKEEIDRGYVVALTSKEQYRSPLELVMHATMPGVIFLEYGNVQVAK
ncbi:hypothetical protein H5410_048074 [Solanum commersonii]|uniref:Uncharacterized protein n=1 Tax=Solanum commersonii TaxID=4109 RepID=A0A9J5XKU3_SOLCO|nr:hypothetical protein H5410_048074 [Solanum commersonii]